LAEHQSVDTFETKRLVAVRLRDEHLGEILRMHRDPKIMATLGGLRADDETAHYLRYLRDNLDHWNWYGYGIWSFSDRVDGRFAGRASLRKNIRVGETTRWSWPTRSWPNTGTGDWRRRWPRRAWG
jgi:RimJ/RimL family protein N-acetyltransferase